MKRVMWFLGLLLLLSIGLTQSGGDAWKRTAVGDLSDAGVDVGFPDGSFLGDQSLTGYQAAVLVDRLLQHVDQTTGCTDAMAGLPDPGFTFDDVPQDHWAYGAVERVAQLGVRDAFPDGAFHGDQFLTGYQTAYLLSRAVDVVDAKTACGSASLQERLGAMADEVATLRAEIASGAVAGPQGPQGPVGPAGPAGPSGPSGADGATGPAGPPGPQGERGVAGPPGPVGAVGPAGSAGPAGPAGPAGEPGPSGADGLMCWDANGNGIGDVQEDINLDGTVDVQDCAGPAGPPGPQGAQGPKGPVGPQGSTGSRGPEGPRGPQGPQGPQGPPGTCNCN